MGLHLKTLYDVGGRGLLNLGAGLAVLGFACTSIESHGALLWNSTGSTTIQRPDRWVCSDSGAIQILRVDPNQPPVNIYAVQNGSGQTAQALTDISINSIIGTIAGDVANDMRCTMNGRNYQSTNPGYTALWDTWLTGMIGPTYPWSCSWSRSIHDNVSEKSGVYIGFESWPVGLQLNIGGWYGYPSNAGKSAYARGSHPQCRKSYQTTASLRYAQSIDVVGSPEGTKHYGIVQLDSGDGTRVRVTVNGDDGMGVLVDGNGAVIDRGREYSFDQIGQGGIGIAPKWEEGKQIQGTITIDARVD